MNRRNQKRESGERDGWEVLRRRDALEYFITAGMPEPLRTLVSGGLTTLTGVAPSGTWGVPLRKGNVLRALLYVVATFFAGLAAIVAGTPLLKLAGALAVVSAMRNFTSGVGHHLTHSPAGLPWDSRFTKAGYNVLSALLLLSSFEDYRKEHGVHHGKVGGAEDPDQKFIEYLEARLTGWVAFLSSVFDPRFHARFLWARLQASVGRGLAWRRGLAAAGLIGALALPGLSATLWLFALTLGYQTAAILSWLSLHLWGGRPESGKPAEIATAVTFGRLLIPEAGFRGLAMLPVYALVRALWLQADLQNHDLHHLGKGPWTGAPYVRTRLLMEGEPLRQTVRVRDMFRVAFDAAGKSKAGRADISGGGILSM
jgi:hypothetical protein